MKTVLKPLFLVLLAFTASASFARIGDEEIRNMESSVVINRIDNSDVDITTPGMAFNFSEGEIKIKFKDPAHPKLQLNNNELMFIVNGTEQKIKFNEAGEAVIKHSFAETNKISILCEDLMYETTVSVYPAWIFAVPVAFLGIWMVRGRFAKKEELQKQEA